MISLKNISKNYGNSLILKDISINFRNEEFVAILGKSGSGKSTLLNIIGGLDTVTSGDVLIDGVSVNKYKDKDFDKYRKNRVGFVFQNYNLINHLSIFDNVAIANDNKKAVLEALEKVDLLKYRNKKPQELSGGERQRVAIARAIVKNTDILLLDEPTGALDSKSGIEIMNLIKSISKNKLVIMVTHDRELANKYSNRIINIEDGKIISDSNKCYDNKYIKKKYKKERMSIKNTFKIILSNMKHKKKRTILVSLASSIGIIGISIILSLTNGVRLYIENEQVNTFANYPIEINKTNLDYSNVVLNNTEVKCNNKSICSRDDISNSDEVVDRLSLRENNLKEFKKYIDSNNKIYQYSNSIEYKYDIDLQIYSNYRKIDNKIGNNKDIFVELVSNKKIREKKYKIIYGKMADNYNELVLVVDKDNVINMSTLYNLDIENIDDLNNKINNSKYNLKLDSKRYNYKEIVGKEYKLLLNSSYYIKNNNNWIDKSNDKEYVEKLIKEGISLKIVGIVKEVEGANNSYLGYNKELIEYVVDSNKNSLVYKDFNNTNDERIKKLGIVDMNDPISINIYPNSYNNKYNINKYIDDYNKKVSEKNKISYTDLIGVLLEGINSIVKIISIILIALVAISLIVSSIMVSIITYISVLERTKEIGILRSIGYSRNDIKIIFKLEKMIEGLLAGIIGIVLSRILIVPINMIIDKYVNINNLAVISIKNTLILLLVSIIITIVSGLSPARKASKMLVVEAIKNE